MSTISPITRLWYGYLGVVYAFTRWTSRHTLFGIRFRTLVFLASLGLIIAAWQLRWPGWAFWLTLILFGYLLFIYWRSARIGHFRFVAAAQNGLPEDIVELLPANEHIHLRVSGIMSVQTRQENVLMHSAEYWQVPLGEHIVMVQRGKDRFLYQFLDGASLQSIRHGWLIYGTRLHSALEVNFLSKWGPEFDSSTFDLFGSKNGEVAPKLRALYFSFDDEETERAVWHNLVADARRVRRDEEIGD